MRRWFTVVCSKYQKGVFMNKVGILAASFVLVLIATPISSAQSYHAFHPGRQWKDNNGVMINAHGGGVLFYKGIHLYG